MDLDDILEDLWEDAARDTRERIGKARADFDRKRRLPGFRARMRTAMLYGSATWAATFGGLGIGAELALGDPIDTILAVVLGGIALPAVGTGLWAWRGKRRDDVLAREADAARLAKRERAELPADVRDEWVRLRRAEALVTDLAAQGLVQAEAVTEAAAMTEQLRVLLVADRRAAELGAEPSHGLRDQLADTADLLVALAVEAVDHQADVVESGHAPTLVDARDRLRSLRSARAEVAAAEHGGDGSAAAAWIEQEVDRRRQQATPPPPADRRDRPTTEPDHRRRQQPG